MSKRKSKYDEVVKVDGGFDQLLESLINANPSDVKKKEKAMKDSKPKKSK